MWAGIVIEYFFAFGMVLLCLVGYLIREWKYNEVTVSAPAALMLSYWWEVFDDLPFPKDNNLKKYQSKSKKQNKTTPSPFD